MKTLIIAVTAIISFLISGISTANAAFFDTTGGKWYMAESQWTKSTNGGTNVQDIGNNLSFSSTGVNGYAEYKSNWSLNMNNSASLSVNYYWNPNGLQKSCGIEMGLTPATDINLNSVSIARGDDSTGAGGFRWYLDLDVGTDDETIEFWSTTSGGVFTINYNASTKLITLDESSSGKSKQYNLTGMFGADQMMSVYLGAATDEAFTTDTPNTAYFSNFQLLNGTQPAGSPAAVPEPASMSLLGLGLLGLMGFRSRALRTKSRVIASEAKQS